MKHRSESGQKPGRQCREKREGENRAVDAEVELDREGHRQLDGEEGPHGEMSEPQSQRCASDEQDHRFGEKQTQVGVTPRASAILPTWLSPVRVRSRAPRFVHCA